MKERIVDRSDPTEMSVISDRPHALKPATIKRKQIIDFDECDKCGVGILFQMNDADDGYFYDCDRVFCEDCGDVGYTICDEDICDVRFDWDDK